MPGLVLPFVLVPEQVAACGTDRPDVRSPLGIWHFLFRIRSDWPDRESAPALTHWNTWSYSGIRQAKAGRSTAPGG